MSYSGKYKPVNPKKYIGKPSEIYYRSLWERKVMIYCDKTESILEWASEEIIIPYVSPWDGKVHRYFPDFYMKVKQRDGNIKKFIVEIKPKKQCLPPPTKPKKRTKKWFGEVKTWGINEAKWKSAIKWCEDREMEFMILNENHLNISYK